jgi:selenocysteine-specific elongation factor
VTQIFDGEIEVLADASRPLRSRQRVRVHLGTEEVLARVSVIGASHAVEPGSRGLAQFRLESPVAAAHGDRFIIRSYSPQRTIAGGVVLDPLAQRHRAAEIGNVAKLLGELSEASSGIGNVAEIFIRASGERGLRIADLHARTSLRREVLTRLIETAASEGSVIDAGGVLINKESFDKLTDSAFNAVEAHHRSDKLSRGFAKETLREQVFKRVEPEVFRAALSLLERTGRIAADQDVLRIATHTTQLSVAEQGVHDRIEEIYMSSQLEAPKLDDALAQAADGTGLDPKSVRKIFQLFIERGELVAVTNEFYFPSSSLAALTNQLREHAKSSGDSTIDVAKFKDIARVSRKYAIPLLEYFDRTRVTQRVGDKRKVL